MLLAIGPIFAIFIQPLWAMLSDRTGKRKLLLILLALCTAGAYLLYYLGASFAVCLLAVLPVVYLRRVSALSQTARAVLCLLAAATAVMLISVLPRLRITNLQYTVLTRADFFTAAKDQLTLYPEYLLPALWPAQDKRGRHTLLRLAGYALAFDVSIHLLLELFYGCLYFFLLFFFFFQAEDGIRDRFT